MLMKTSPNIEERIVIVIFSNDNRCNNVMIFGNPRAKANIMDILIKIDNLELIIFNCVHFSEIYNNTFIPQNATTLIVIKIGITNNIENKK